MIRYPDDIKLRQYQGLRTGERPEPRQLQVLNAITTLAGRWRSNAGRKAVEAYLLRAALRWSYAKIARRVGMDRNAAMVAAKKGRGRVRHAVDDGAITLKMVETLLGGEIYRGS